MIDQEDERLKKIRRLHIGNTVLSMTKNAKSFVVKQKKTNRHTTFYIHPDKMQVHETKEGKKKEHTNFEEIGWEKLEEELVQKRGKLRGMFKEIEPSDPKYKDYSTIVVKQLTSDELLALSRHREIRITNSLIESNMQIIKMKDAPKYDFKQAIVLNPEGVVGILEKFNNKYFYFEDTIGILENFWIK